jgi:hypothetical protein
MEEKSVKEKLEELDLIDAALFRHGFCEYMRDYFLEYESGGIQPYAGRYICWFTHCVVANTETRVDSETWKKSWSKEYIDYQEWINAGEPDGIVWGTNWSLTYPGLEYIQNSDLARRWSMRLEKEMHEVTIDTEIFHIQLIFHDVITQKLGPDLTVIDKVIFPIK